jgi:hypothetical protein
MTRVAARVLLFTLGGLGAACSIGEGEGEVTSERLFAVDCWNGAYELQPDFFGANPFIDQMTLRVQRGDKDVEISDGLSVLVHHLPEARERLGQELRVALPLGVQPPELPEVPAGEAPDVSMTMYLHDTCHLQNVALYAVSGTITFDSLFNGNPNEDSAAERLTEARFSARFGDPRDAEVVSGMGEPVELAYPEERMSEISGSFRFFFHRGRPSQAFP